jgi:hypothetical protein
MFSRNRAITAMTLAERLAAGYGNDDPFVIGWREELSLFRAIGQDYPSFSRLPRLPPVLARRQHRLLARYSGEWRR